MSYLKNKLLEYTPANLYINKYIRPVDIKKEDEMVQFRV